MGRWRRVGAAALLALLCITALGTIGVGVASAQDPPPPPAPTPIPDDPPDDEVEIEFLKYPEGIPFSYATHYSIWAENCSLLTELEGETDEWVTWQSFLEADENYSCGDQYMASGSNDAIEAATQNPTYGRNGFPTSAYECGVDEGAWNHFDRKVFSSICSLLFGINKSVVGWSIAVLNWAFSFQIGEALAPYAGRLGQRYFNGVGGGEEGSLYWLALFFTTVYAATKALRGAGSRAAGELGLSVILLMAFWAIVIFGSGFGGAVNSTLDVSKQMSASVGRLTLDGDAAAGDCTSETIGIILDGEYGGTKTLICPLANSLHTALIERPYDLINWGADLQGTPCGAMRDEILGTAPHGNNDTPRFLMGAAGCENAANYNHDPEASRLGLAATTVVVAILALILLVLIAFSLLIAQIVLVLMVALMPFAMISATLPGAGRNIFWKWFAAMTKTVVSVVMLTALLAFYLSTLNVIIEATDGQPWAAQAGAMIMVTLGAFYLRKRLADSAANTSSAFARRTAQTVSPGNAGTGGLYQAAGLGNSLETRGISAGQRRSKSSALAVAGMGYVASRTATGAAAKKVAKRTMVRNTGRAIERGANSTSRTARRAHRAARAAARQGQSWGS